MPIATALVVDDSKSARIMLSRLVQKSGLSVSMVESGEEAIAFLEANPHPDVIFMDHMMPGMDGLETTRKLSEQEDTRSIPIFMYTSKEGPAYEEEVLSSGATGMLGKPAKPERLLEIIEQLNAQAEPVEPTETQVSAEADEPETSLATTTESDEPAIASPSTEVDEISLSSVPEAETEQEQEPSDALEPSTPVALDATQEEEEEMSKEMIEEVASSMIARAIEDALQPLNDSIHRLETSISENQSEIRKLNSRQSSNISMVTQPVLDASLKQTTVQLQNQLTNEIKSIRDLIEQRAEITPETLEKIQQIASAAGAESGTTSAEKSASSAAEAVAAKVAAAQAQIQIQQDVQPLAGQAKRANALALVAILAAGAAIALTLLM